MLPSSLPEPIRPDAALLALRPAIAAEPARDADAPVGRFLHATLRPVLKLQHALLLQLVADFVHDHHMALARAAPAEQQRQLAELLGRNTKPRYTVLGLISGHFTAAEYAFYRLHRAELNRRLLELAQRRVLGHAAEVVALAASIAAA